MKRFFLFLSVLLGTALIVFLLVIGTNWQAYVTLFSNQEGLVEGNEWIEKTYSLKGLTQYIGQNPKHVSVVSYRPNKPDSGIYYKADEPRVMGALSNLFLVIEYARRVENGTINADERISISKFDLYRLPKINENAYLEAINTLRNRNLIDDKNTISLQSAIQAMVEFNALTIADYFYFKFGVTAMDSLQTRLSLDQTQRFVPFLGLHLVMSPKLLQNEADSLIKIYNNLDRAEFNRQVFRFANEYLNDASFRIQATNAFKDKGLDVLFTNLRDMHQLFPKTTARELTNVMEQLQKGTLISEKVSNRVLKLLSWPLREPQMRDNFKKYSAIYDSRMGILNGLDAGVSAYTGKKYIQAVMFDSLQVGFWVHMSSNHMHQDYQQRLIWDPALQEVSRKAIEKGKISSKQ